MLDYRRWIERAVGFMASLQILPGKVGLEMRLAPPIKPEEVENLARKLRLGIPTPISDFLIYGSANCMFKYFWEFPRDMLPLVDQIFTHEKSSLLGGADLCVSENFMCDQTGCFDHAMDEVIGSCDRDYWLNSMPVLSIGNGDYIALYNGDNQVTPPGSIIYLDHDGCVTGTVLSSSFDQFLLVWESFCYIIPTWMLSFFDSSGGIMSDKRESLRQLFRV